MSGGYATVAGIGTAFPPDIGQQDAWDGFFDAHYEGRGAARRVWRGSGVVRRHAAVDPRVEDFSAASTAARMRRFVDEALPLGKDAVTRSLAAAGIAAADVDALTVVSCTGYATPGVDILLARDLGMPPTVQRLAVGHMGCYAAIPGLAAVADAAVARDRVGVLLCVELTSLHVQPPTDDLEQVVAHALFSDAAAAVTVVPGGGGGGSGSGVAGVEVVDVAARTDAATAGDMRWDVTDQGFRMTLSSRVPKVLRAHVRDATTDLLAANGLGLGDVDRWLVHPGGPSIVASVADALGLGADDVAASHRVLRDHGNCSSATVLLVLDDVLRTDAPEPGQHLVAMAFGPGLTLYLALLRAR